MTREDAAKQIADLFAVDAEEVLRIGGTVLVKWHSGVEMMVTVGAASMTGSDHLHSVA